MIKPLAFLFWLQLSTCTYAFQSLPSTQSTTLHSTELFLAKRRQTKQNREIEKTRPKSFYDKIDAKSATSTAELTEEERAREERARAAPERMEKRPTVSTLIVDEESGTEIVAQGQNVMDVVTRKAVQLSPRGPDYRLAQFFPGVPPEIRQKYRYANWSTIEVPEMVEALRAACSTRDGTIPPHPSVTNKGIDFVLANRDRLGSRMKQTLGRLTMRAASQGNIEQMKQNQMLWKNYLTLENHISAPFRQMMMDAEGRIGPNFGNLDLQAYANGALYERCANYLVLKGMVAHWEKKVVDADANEKTVQTRENYIRSISRGDPRRYLPDPPILFTLKECTQVCYMAQQMTKAFVDTPELFQDLPPEVRFVEAALNIQGGTPLRQFMLEEFCPAEGIDGAGLREGVRRLRAQMENMQIDPYGDLTRLLEKLEAAMAVGTEDERDPYLPYLTKNDGPGSFQTYTFNHEKLSLVRFLDGQYNNVENAASKPKGMGLGDLFNFGGSLPTAPSSPVPSADSYKVPEARAMGRPHELGWLDLLNDKPEGEKLQLGKVPAGRIIPDDE
ncbi:hypothetical protein FisN_24Lh104 [Fistulifera solaris]|uniref:Uncharacterized protein n=1 Tax=Fistulifera solaris TaxID=1519565 RepID=A0A1Z5K9N4_FISSO|nr:hypothetical protein FisN_24Lh104 [Fistulifera solaris]|eukprot:GAX22821.1 hypothetical protein FisN_24Lh104 [Fistulifera solaris]